VSECAPNGKSAAPEWTAAYRQEIMDIIERIGNLLLHPRRIWPEIAVESDTSLTPQLFYVSVLGAIGPVALLVKSMGGAVFIAVFSYTFTFFEVYMLAQTVDVLAPWFGGQRNFPRSLQLIAYSLTAWWIGDLCQFTGLPAVAVLAIAFLTGAYCVYTFYSGVATLNKCVPKKALAFALLVAVCMALLSIVLESALLLVLKAVFGFGQ
jgi:hypothetical protein